jgi:large subunit ribosomal protein L18
METKKKRKLRLKRHARLRKKVSGTQERPRLAVFKSANHFYAQIINDDLAHTLASASTLSPELKSSLEKTGDSEAAGKVGELIAAKAKKKKIKQVVFDHGGFGYLGNIKQFAEKARKSGLKF